MSSDASGFASAVIRRYAYVPKGQRVQGLGCGHKPPRPALMAARIGKAFAVPLLFEGTSNPALCNAWLETALCPCLHDTQVVVRDNVASHKSATTRALLPHTGATLLFVPPYAPDLNPLADDFAARKKLRE